MSSIGKILGNGNIRPTHTTNLQKVDKPFGNIQMTGLSKVDNNELYPNLSISTTPGNTGLNEGTARGFLNYLDYLDNLA